MKQFLFKVIFLLSFFITLTLKGQYVDTSYSKKKEKPAEEKEENFWSKTFFGGGLGASFGNPTYIDIAPIFGYRITEKFHAGIGISYQYYEEKYTNYTYSTSIYGGSVFGRYFFYKDLFGHAEVEYLNLENYTNPTKRIGIESVLVGGGYIQRFSAHSGITAVALYNLTQSEYSPYASPLIIRIGFTVGF